MLPRQIFALVIAGVVTLLGFFSIGNLVENVDAGDVVCIQAPWSGKLTWYTTPGTKWQGFGKVTTYKNRDLLEFGGAQALRLRFNDGGHATMSGSISWELPVDETHLTELHVKFGSQEAAEKALVRTVIEKSAFMTGPHMSSTESYASRRNDLFQLIEDQAQNGVIATKSKTHVEKDALTGMEKTVTTVDVEADKDGKVIREDDSPLARFGVKTFGLNISEIKYEDTVENQIKTQQQSTMAVQIAIADAKRAEQQVLTTNKEGEANAAKARWDQKTVAAKQEEEALMVKTVAETLAKQQLEVAKLATASAEQKKLADIALGEGESQRRKLVMEADGALEKKLEAMVQINAAYAQAIGQHQGPLVPSIVMGGDGKAASSVGATQLIELLSAKAAKDLSFDLSLPVKK